ncbi:hypothetical protein C0Q70_08366 [Pomacea canaliculata]|uniref:Uncharacterized protein n=1 Tax=Pomacea canaliculata TaxID=400727 RepID=A0A2T7PHM4_POMCA|nr:hypothetical protein C0Q70_08366 [Pomacea canaliculata]
MSKTTDLAFGVALVMFVRDNQFRSTVDMLLVNLAFADIGMCGLCFPFVSASNFAQCARTLAEHGQRRGVERRKKYAGGRRGKEIEIEKERIMGMTETEKENFIYCFCGNNFVDVLHCFLGERPSRDEDLCQIARRLGNPALPGDGVLLHTHLCLQSPRPDQSLLQKLPGPAGLQDLLHSGDSFRDLLVAIHDTVQSLLVLPQRGMASSVSPSGYDGKVIVVRESSPLHSRQQTFPPTLPGDDHLSPSNGQQRPRGSQHSRERHFRQ